MDKPKRIALLFDGDNASPMYIPRIISYISRIGEITVSKVYADWNRVRAKLWLQPGLNHYILPKEVFNYTPGKNASDFCLMGDALEMAFKGEVDTVCIVSSDSDFTDVILRLHRYKVESIVIGKREASMALVTVCDLFIDETTLPEGEKLSVRHNTRGEQTPVSVDELLKLKEKAKKSELKPVAKLNVAKFLKNKKGKRFYPRVRIRKPKGSN